MPLYRRIPKRGFTNRNRKEFVAINVNVLDRFDNGAEVTVDTLIESGIVKDPKDGIKILANGELKRSLLLRLTHSVLQLRRRSRLSAEPAR